MSFIYLAEFGVWASFCLEDAITREMSDWPCFTPKRDSRKRLRLNHSILLQSHRGIALHKPQINLMAQQLPNIPHPVLDHCRPLQTQSPSVHSHTLRKAHRLQHLRPKHAAVPDLYPLPQPLVPPKHLQARFRVRVVRGLEPQPLDPHFPEEHLHEPNQPAQRQPKVRNDTLDLMELGEVGGVDGLVAENAVDGKVARRTRVGR